MKKFYKVSPIINFEDDIYYIEQVDDNILVSSIVVFNDGAIFNMDLDLTDLIVNYPDMIEKYKKYYKFEEITEEEHNAIKSKGIELHE